MADCGQKACCICISVLVILTIPITLISLSLVTHNPKLYLEDLYIPALNNNNNNNNNNQSQSNTTNSKLNTFIFIVLELRNVMRMNGLRYEDLNITFFYAFNRSFPVGSFVVPGFYQGVRKTAHRRDVVRTSGLPWEDAFDKLSRGLTVDFAVELAATVKLRRCGKYMKRKVVVAAANVSFDSSGEEVDKKTDHPIPLVSI